MHADDMAGTPLMLPLDRWVSRTSEHIQTTQSSGDTLVEKRVCRNCYNDAPTEWSSQRQNQAMRAEIARRRSIATVPPWPSRAERAAASPAQPTPTTAGPELALQRVRAGSDMDERDGTDPSEQAVSYTLVATIGCLALVFGCSSSWREALCLSTTVLCMAWMHHSRHTHHAALSNPVRGYDSIQGRGDSSVVDTAPVASGRWSDRHGPRADNVASSASGFERVTDRVIDRLMDRVIRTRCTGVTQQYRQRGYHAM
jgi:hypothetical protein